MDLIVSGVSIAAATVMHRQVVAVSSLTIHAPAANSRRSSTEEAFPQAPRSITTCLLTKLIAVARLTTSTLQRQQKSENNKMQS